VSGIRPDSAQLMAFAIIAFMMASKMIQGII
jgi:hypothetical protein